jgi:hypothetical protein
MRDVVGTSCVLRIGDKYRVDKKLNGKNYYFGTYPTLIMALMVRDELISKGWPLSEVKHPCNSEKYISCLKGKFVVYKNINGFTRTFGSYKTLQEAKDVRDALICAGWPYVSKYKKHYLPKYIRLNNGSTFQIQKWIDGEKRHFGNFRSLDAAVEERDYLIKHGWDYDAMESLDECVDGEIIWLGRKVSV